MLSTCLFDKVLLERRNTYNGDLLVMTETMVMRKQTAVMHIVSSDLEDQHHYTSCVGYPVAMHATPTVISVGTRHSASVHATTPLPLLPHLNVVYAAKERYPGSRLLYVETL